MNAERCSRCNEPGSTVRGTFYHSRGWWARCADQPFAVLTVGAEVVAELFTAPKA